MGSTTTPIKQPPPSSPGTRPDLTENQKHILREVGQNTHTVDRIKHWQCLVAANHCYFHNTSTHTSAKCYAILNATKLIQEHEALTGVPSATTTTTTPSSVPARQIKLNQDTDHPSYQELELILNNLDIKAKPAGRQVSLPTIHENPWTKNNQYASLYPSSDEDSENSEPLIHSLEDFPYPDGTTEDKKNKKVTFKDTVNSYTHFIVDSGEDSHMCNNKLLFTHLQPHPSVTHVTLGDGHTQQQCLGVGTIDVVIGNNNRIVLHHVLYVPTLKESLFSTLTHVQNPGCSFHSKRPIIHWNLVTSKYRCQ